LREEQGLALTPSAEAPPLRLKRDIMERVLMARLTDPPPGYPQPPLEYLLGCYGRASAASRGLPALSDKQALAHLQATLANSRALVVSYAGLMLTMDMFPQVTPMSCRPVPQTIATKSAVPAVTLPAA
jgi:ubiquitin conjugation factor E4 B